ncbi:MAG: DUF4402 domain-containing protein [Desulfocapsa sp.]|uniref:DUF4402 domain-containing protein n=1 Tax=Desulfotalea psychrophila TaxID=84980 RepID=A0ABS3AU06_9BACT|nr:DUF4402 domain-containing protein [Desulfocapsa sp.]MBN4048738.1 DUF4402 domain-containing protein [bacterium AH-315-N22]MBN4068578.1 DUF4402 domain-containing protein [Desulfotalea psychrophila]
MWKTRKKSTFLASAALLGIVALSGTTVTAGTVDVPITATVTSSLVEDMTTAMNFGSIELIPAGDTIVINASGAGSGAGGAAAVPASSGASVVTGGTSALITISSPIGFDVDVSYEVSVVLTDGTTSATMSLIDANSGGGTTDGTVTHAAGVDTLIHVGGSLVLPSGATTGTYTGSTAVTMNYT